MRNLSLSFSLGWHTWKFSPTCFSFTPLVTTYIYIEAVIYIPLRNLWLFTFFLDGLWIFTFNLFTLAWDFWWNGRFSRLPPFFVTTNSSLLLCIESCCMSLNKTIKTILTLSQMFCFPITALEISYVRIFVCLRLSAQDLRFNCFKIQDLKFKDLFSNFFWTDVSFSARPLPYLLSAWTILTLPITTFLVLVEKLSFLSCSSALVLVTPIIRDSSEQPSFR